jgi:hypothetical protein
MTGLTQDPVALKARASLVLVIGAIIFFVGAERPRLLAMDAPPERSGDAAAPESAPGYSIIPQRNVFHLQPPPTPENTPAPPLNLPKVYLTGLVRNGPEWKALLVVKPEFLDERGQRSIFYLTMAQGETRVLGSGEKRVTVQVDQIHADQQKIDFINSGSPMTLSMKDNSLDGPPADHPLKTKADREKMRLLNSIHPAPPQPLLPPLTGETPP